MFTLGFEKTAGRFGVAVAKAAKEGDLSTGAAKAYFKKYFKGGGATY